MADAEHGYVLYQRGEEAGSDVWDDTVLIKAYDNAISAVKAKLAEQNPDFAAVHPSTKTKKKKRNKSKSKKKNHHRGAGKWKVGDLCRAVYTDDGEVYEARILSIDEAETCTVKYVGYGNEEELPLSSLLPLVSEDSSQDVRTDTASDTGSVSHVPVAPEVNAGKHRSKQSLSSHQHKTQNKRHMPKWPWDGYVPTPPVFPQVPPQHVPAFQPPQFPGFPPPPAPHYPGYQAAGPAAPPLFPCVPPPPPLFTDQGEENEALYSMLISWYMSGYHTGYYQGLKHSASSTAAGHGIPR